MKGIHRMNQRVQDLENKLGVIEGPVYVNVVLLWQPGLPLNMKGAVYMKSSHGPGRQFSNDEEAEAWIAQDRKRFPIEDTSTIEEREYPLH